jgi:hypothetical protein
VAAERYLADVSRHALDADAAHGLPDRQQFALREPQRDALAPPGVGRLRAGFQAVHRFTTFLSGFHVHRFMCSKPRPRPGSGVAGAREEQVFCSVAKIGLSEYTCVVAVVSVCDMPDEPDEPEASAR